MGFDYVFVTQDRHSLDVIAASADGAQQRVTKWIPTLAMDQHEGEGEFGACLPELPAPSEVTFTGFFLIGRLASQPDALNALLSYLTVAETAWGKQASIGVLIGYERKGSTQSQRDSDEWQGGIKLGRAYLGHKATPSGAAKDRATLSLFYRGLAAQSLWPLTVTEDAGNVFVAHATGGDLFLSYGGIRGENPKLVRCELPGPASAAHLRDQLCSLLDQYGNGKLFDLRWVLNVQGDSAMVAYQAVRQSSPKTRKHDLSFSYQISSLSSLLSVMPLTNKGSAMTQVAQFHLDQELGRFLVETDSQGHQVRIELTESLPVQSVAEIVGLDLVKE